MCVFGSGVYNSGMILGVKVIDGKANEASKMRAY